MRSKIKLFWQKILYTWTVIRCIFREDEKLAALGDFIGYLRHATPEEAEKSVQIVRSLHTVTNTDDIAELIKVARNTSRQLLIATPDNELEYGKVRFLKMASTEEAARTFSTFLALAKERIRQDLLQTMTEEEYFSNSALYDKDFAELSLTLQSRQLEAQLAETELQYYKQMNDPNGIPSTQAFQLWNRVEELRKQYKDAEEHLNCFVNGVPAESENK